MSPSAPYSLAATARRAIRRLRQAAQSLARSARTFATGAAATLALASVGCAGHDPEPLSEILPAASVPKAPARPSEPKLFGRYRMTFYYVAGEEEAVEPRPATLVASAEPKDRAAGAEETSDTSDASSEISDEMLLAAGAPERITLYDRDCRELAQVTRAFLRQLNMQGTGKLRDGRTLNIGKPCDCPHSPCYREVSGQRWGFAGNGRPLQAFRTVAVDPRLIKLGSLLYIPELDGRTMPGRAPWGGFVHDGCVTGDDTGGGVQGKQLDLFVGRRVYYRALGKRGGSHAWAKKVTVYDGRQRCQRSGGKVSKSQRGAI